MKPNMARSTALKTRRKNVDREALLRRNLARRIKIENNHVSLKARQEVEELESESDDEAEEVESNSDVEEAGAGSSEDDSDAEGAAAAVPAQSTTTIHSAAIDAESNRAQVQTSNISASPLHNAGTIAAVVLGPSTMTY